MQRQRLKKALKKKDLSAQISRPREPDLGCRCNWKWRHWLPIIIYDFPQFRQNFVPISTNQLTRFSVFPRTFFYIYIFKVNSEKTAWTKNEQPKTTKGSQNLRNQNGNSERRTTNYEISQARSRGYRKFSDILQQLNPEISPIFQITQRPRRRVSAEAIQQSWMRRLLCKTFLTDT